MVVELKFWVFLDVAFSTMYPLSTQKTALFSFSRGWVLQRTGIVSDVHCSLVFTGVTLAFTLHSAWSCRRQLPNPDGQNLLSMPPGSTECQCIHLPTHCTNSLIANAKHSVPARCLFSTHKLVSVQLYPPTHTRSETSWCCHRCPQGCTPEDCKKHKIVKATREKVLCCQLPKAHLFSSTLLHVLCHGRT